MYFHLSRSYPSSIIGWSIFAPVELLTKDNLTRARSERQGVEKLWAEAGWGKDGISEARDKAVVSQRRM